ncbi:putative late blight resistance protein homolog R1B-23 [Bidens hawaiensis]|uniref:putative late blight resistance protein homolog R1B-23 n=1 Tax=Bidens hawaiensis TaxID=980011 RepID=UPI00404B4185
MDTLALSYNHLPSHLRPCFLYLGVFPGDCDIPVHKLIRLWVAQGFIDETGSKSLEDVAEDYLMDLLGRSLVTVSEKGDDGEIKACHVHDLLRSLCMWKANEQGFSPISYRYGRVSSSISPVLDAQIRTNPLPGMSSEHSTQHVGTSSEHSTHHVGTSSEHSTQHVNFVLCCPIELGECFQECKPFDHGSYKYLRILDMESIFISSFPMDIPNLVNLRYLAINSEDGNPPTSISKLTHLQILIISSTTNIILPRTTWDIKYLRHLYIKSGQTLIEDLSSGNLIGMLSNLQTISGVCPSASCLSILTRTPNLRKISFCGPLISTLGVLEFPNIRSLNCLQTLKLSNTMKYYAPVKSCSLLMFPERLTRLTLSETCLDWNEIQTFGLLPNLEVLKLNVDACIGEIWEASDVEFANLKFLKLQDLDIVKWEASSRQFPRLQRLVVCHCSRLQEIPCDIGEILTLELIEVSWCGESTARSATMIQKEQERNGNDFLKVLTCVHRDLLGKRKRPSYD